VSATVYFGATEATDPNTASSSPDDVSATRFYALGGSTVATATADTGSAPLWALLFGDIQGSASVSMELVADTGVASGFEPASITHEVVRDAYMPYGAARGDGDTTDDLAIDRGWLGQHEDSGTGLTYLNAHYYDPTLGRFLSPDPLMDPGDPRTLDPYRYADNNPISYTDATGLAPSCSGLTGTAYQNCNNYSKNTYNYATGKTVAQKTVEQNINLAKTTPVKKNPFASPSASPPPLRPNGISVDDDGFIISLPGQTNVRSNFDKKWGEYVRNAGALAFMRKFAQHFDIFDDAQTRKLFRKAIPGAGIAYGYIYGAAEGYQKYDDMPLWLRAGGAHARGVAAALGVLGGEAIGASLAGPLTPLGGFAVGTAAAIRLSSWGEQSVDFVVETSWFAYTTWPDERAEFRATGDLPYVGSRDMPWISAPRRFFR
jgi:RHS repeat-associated protein